MSTNSRLSGAAPATCDTQSPPSAPPESFEHTPGSDHDTQQQPEDALDDEAMPYPEPSSEQMLLPPPNFRPFFTLIEDTSSGEHYHPYVYYIFADDDPILVTAASMRGLGVDETKYLPNNASEEEEQQRDQDIEGSDEQDLLAESPLPPAMPGVKEHYLIIDVGADGRTINDAHSLSSEWQVTKTDVRIAPSFDESSPDQGFMLRVEGVELPKMKKGKGKGQAGHDRLAEAKEKSQGDIFTAMDGLIQSIEGSLEIAEKISGTNLNQAEEVTPPDILHSEEDRAW